MARNRPLLGLLQDLRAEIRASSNAAHNASARDTQVALLQRVQETLWEEADWPFLRIRRDMPVQAGQRYYAPPDDIPIDRVETLEIRYGQEWCLLKPGIGRAQYTMYDSDLDVRAWPVERWQVYEDDQIELWPLPADDTDPVSLEGTLRVHGIRKLKPLVADDDTADLDDRLIVLYAAAEILGAQGAKDAPLKLAAAEKRKKSLTGNQSKVKQFSLGGSEPDDRYQPRGLPRVHYRTTETG